MNSLSVTVQSIQRILGDAPAGGDAPREVRISLVFGLPSHLDAGAIMDSSADRPRAVLGNHAGWRMPTSSDMAGNEQHLEARFYASKADWDIADFIDVTIAESITLTALKTGLPDALR